MSASCVRVVYLVALIAALRTHTPPSSKGRFLRVADCVIRSQLGQITDPYLNDLDISGTICMVYLMLPGGSRTICVI